MVRSLFQLAALVTLLSSCSANGIYRAYLGEARDELHIATVEGAKYLRTDIINRHVDTVRFLSIDGQAIENAEEYDAVQLEPGFHELQVYFSWDLGNQRGLAPALVEYAASRPSLSRQLSFNALAGYRYVVRAQPVFNAGRQDITNLSHVNFWVEDHEGNEIVTREQGRFVAGRP